MLFFCFSFVGVDVNGRWPFAERASAVRCSLSLGSSRHSLSVIYSWWLDLVLCLYWAFVFDSQFRHGHSFAESCDTSRIPERDQSSVALHRGLWSGWRGLRQRPQLLRKRCGNDCLFSRLLGALFGWFKDLFPVVVRVVCSASPYSKKILLYWPIHLWFISN